MSIESLLERRERLLGPGFPLFYDKPVHLVRGDGVWLYDDEGRRYLDCYNNVPHVGHCHPHVVEALARQAAILNTHTRYLHEGILEYVERLTATFDPPLSMALLSCSGSEANELAMRIARVCTGGEGFICTDYAYHGNTTALAQVSRAFQRAASANKHIRMIPAPDSYRTLRGLSGDLLADAYANEVKAAIESLEADGTRLAGWLADTVFSSDGLPDVPPGFMRKAVAYVRAAGGLYIADEVQPGLGRMGDRMWGYQHYGVVPDIVTLGKPMGNGHPLAGTVTRKDLCVEFGKKVMYFNTFGGNPVSCAVGQAVLDVIEREGLQHKARVTGGYVLAGLRRLQEKYAIVGDVRGRGLFFAVELVHDRASKVPAAREAKRIVEFMRDHHILLSRIGKYENVLKMRPPMAFTPEHGDLLLETLDDAFATLQSGRAG